MTSDSSPIKIGYCLSLTGPLSGNSKSARLAHDIWRDDVNSRGGLLGRPVELVRYDDEGDASRVPSLYARLVDEDRVDLVIGGTAPTPSRPRCPKSFRASVFLSVSWDWALTTSWSTQTTSR
ncbi:ABC transporter substrate-binding protein [Bradyrhizobium sp. LA2.1]|uniref:ABC transporter substrate-binding protein n=1 Tax=Bradyrhizobium sp. LA2.1 TaxID=3156376 RepID=UPI0033925DC8